MSRTRPCSECCHWFRPDPRGRRVGRSPWKVHNGFGFDFPEKSVVRGPFGPRIKHVYFHGHRTLNQVGAVMLKAEQDPSLLRIPRLAAAALRG